MQNWSIGQWMLAGAISAAVVVGGGYGVWSVLVTPAQVAKITGEACNPGDKEERNCSCGSQRGTQSRSCASDGNSWGGWGKCSCESGGGGGGDTTPACNNGQRCRKVVNGESCVGTIMCTNSTDGQCVPDDASCGKSGRQCNTNADCASVGVGAICDTSGKCMDPGGPVGCGYSDINSCPKENRVTEPGGDAYCDAQGRKCSQYRVECYNGSSWCYIKSEEQCGAPGSCGGETRTTPRPSQSVVPSPSPQITIACLGLTKSIAEPVMGDTVQLTCSGSVTPAGATSLSYQFRYRINQGSWQTLLSSGAKADLAIDACGTYAVQCRTCGVVAGATQCSPVWVGAN